jgi:phospholipase/carboxylesterase
MSDLLPAVVVEPPGEVTGSVVWLHGLGADGHDFEPLIPMLGLPELGVRVVLPHAPSTPVTINGGMTMPAWYDIRPGDLRQRNDEAGIRASATRIQAWLDAEAAQVPPGRLALAGFSQGGAMALHLGLRQTRPLAGVVALSTYLVCQDSVDAEADPSSLGVPIFQAHGTRDMVVDPARGEEARDRLRARGHQVEWHAYPMGHEVCPPELLELKRWFAEVFGSSDEALRRR